LLITVDCGISNVAEVGRAQALGLDVIVLDHHLPPTVLPEGYAVINPKRPDCQYPYKMLAGVGVAFKLVQALNRAGLRTSFKARQLLDIVTLGTVADVAPLDGENRVLVKYGLGELNRTRRPGLRALIEVAAVKGPITSRTIGYTLGPRINAVGRLEDAIDAYTLLLCDDAELARGMAANLDNYNVRRQQLTTDMIERAKELAHSSGKAQRRIIVLDGKDFPSGILGLVASRLVEAFNRPVLVLEAGDELCRGSARSIKGFSMVDALAACHDLFTKYGGHAMAAGFSLVPANLDALEERLEAIALQQIDDDMLQPSLAYDAELPLSAHSWTLLDQIQQLEPFGHGNDEPLWATHNLRVVEARRMGNQGQHLKLRIHDGVGNFGEAVAWNMGERQPEFSRNVRVDIAYTLEPNEWQGRRTIQMKVKDLRQSNGAETR
jgi:single-stranded-DNA-specific exonuclease